MSNSTGLFSPISPLIPGEISRGETIMKFLGQQEKDMPIASFAMDELPALQYPSELEKEGGDDGDDVETNPDEEMMGPGESSIREVQTMVEDESVVPLAMSCPPTPLVEEVSVVYELSS